MKQKIEFPNPASILKLKFTDIAVTLAEYHFGRKQKNETETDFLQRILDSVPKEAQLLGPLDAMIVKKQNTYDVVGLDDVMDDVMDDELIDELIASYFIRWIVSLQNNDNNDKTLWWYTQLAFILTQALGHENQGFVEECKKIDHLYNEGCITSLESIYKKIEKYADIKEIRNSFTAHKVAQLSEILCLTIELRRLTNSLDKINI